MPPPLPPLWEKASKTQLRSSGYLNGILQTKLSWENFTSFGTFPPDPQLIAGRLLLWKSKQEHMDLNFVNFGNRAWDPRSFSKVVGLLSCNHSTFWNRKNEWMLLVLKSIKVHSDMRTSSCILWCMKLVRTFLKPFAAFTPNKIGQTHLVFWKEVITRFHT